MKRLFNLIPAISLAMAMLGSHPVAASAATVVGTINGGGTAIMTDGMGVTTFSMHATLFSDGSAKGRIDCVDRMGSAPGYPGNIFGDVKSWSRNADGNVTLHVIGKFVAIPGGLVVPGGLPFDVTIQRFGGAGVGHWTLDVAGLSSPNGGPICQELLTSGQIRWS
jgi:hypothetical protein